jgi:hypothetical protein
MEGFVLELHRRGIALVFMLALSISLLPLPAYAQGNENKLVLLASGQGAPRGIAISNGFVYWTDAASGTINKISVGGGNVTVLAKSPRWGQPGAVTVDGDYVYWTDFINDTVRRVNSAGGQVTILAAHQDYPLGILIDHGYVYWAESLVGNIKRIPIDGNGPIETIVGSRIGVSDFAVHEGYVYWAEGSMQGAGVSQIGRMALQGGKPLLFIRTIKPWSITISGSYLFWTGYRWGGVYKVPLIGGQWEVVGDSSVQNDDFMITSDDSNVYWTENLSGNIMSAPVAGGAAIKLASNRTDPYDLASDGMNLVWTEAKAGNVMLYHLRNDSEAIYSQPVAFTILSLVAVTGVAILLIYNQKRKHKKSLSTHQ